jgi:hypothetical protein
MRKIGLLTLLVVLALGSYGCILQSVMFGLYCPAEPPIVTPSPDGGYTVRLEKLGGCYMDSVHWGVWIELNSHRGMIFDAPRRVEVRWTGPHDLAIDTGTEPWFCDGGLQREQWSDVDITYLGEPCQPRPPLAPTTPPRAMQ